MFVKKITYIQITNNNNTYKAKYAKKGMKAIFAFKSQFLLKKVITQCYHYFVCEKENILIW